MKKEYKIGYFNNVNDSDAIEFIKLDVKYPQELYDDFVKAYLDYIELDKDTYYPSKSEFFKNLDIYLDYIEGYHNYTLLNNNDYKRSDVKLLLLKEAIDKRVKL